MLLWMLYCNLDSSLSLAYVTLKEKTNAINSNSFVMILLIIIVFAYSNHNSH